MATELTIKKSELTNEMDLMVTAIDGDGEVVSKHRVRDGVDLAISVWPGQELYIKEVEKEVANTADGEDLGDVDGQGDGTGTDTEAA